MSTKKSEKGELMIESMIIVILTLFLLIWILAVGFIYYQKNLVTTIANDAAVKVAATYSDPSMDLIMGYTSVEDFSNRPLYRNYTTGKLKTANEKNAQAYVRYMLKRTNFLGTIEDLEADVDVKLRLVLDSPMRKHVEVTTTCTFQTPFGEVFSLFGMDREITYQSTGYADCTDLADYLATTDFAARLAGGKVVKSKVLDCLNSIIKLYNNIFG